jgi:hypothetical protein
MSLPAGELIFDRYAPFPELTWLHTAAERGDWPEIQRIYGGLGSWEMRTAAVRAVGEVAGSERFLEPAAQADGLARLMLASRYVELGWEARTAARAPRVSQDQFKTFHEHLRSAEKLLIDITAEDPANAAAWTMRLMTVRGLELGQSEALRRYERLAAHHPHHLAGQWQILQQLCPKWGGTFEKLHAYASERTAASPPGSMNAILVVNAHLEHGMSLEGAERLMYLQNPPVRDDVYRAAAHSVLHPAFQPGHNWVSAHSYFAMFHSVAGDRNAAAVHFRAMGGWATREPWSHFFGSPEQKFVEHRSAALGRA